MYRGGGVTTPKEYCDTIQMIYDHNPDQHGTSGMSYAIGFCEAVGHPIEK